MRILCAERRKKVMKLSLVCPCYNEGENIEAFYRACTEAFSGKVDSYELIFINDGSRDNTWDKLSALADEPNVQNIKLINFSRNFGKEAAMYAGLSKAEGEYTTIIDTDLQQKPETVLEMIEILDNNPDIDCVAAYQEWRRESKLIVGCKKLFYKLINKICDINFRSGASDFRTFRRSVVEAVLSVKECHRFLKGIFSWVGFNTHYMPYTADTRAAGKSSWSFWKLLRYAIGGIVSFTTFPLKLASFVGGAMSAMSLLYMLFVVVQKLVWGISVEGYATIIVLILLIGGIQLLCLGILGEYISRIYIQGKHRPICVIKEYKTVRRESAAQLDKGAGGKDGGDGAQ